MIPGMKKVLIVQTGSIEYVPDSYYERYKDEGLLLVPEDETRENAEREEASEGTPEVVQADAKEAEVQVLKKTRRKK